jgi:hypothetical protein
VGFHINIVVAKGKTFPPLVMKFQRETIPWDSILTVTFGTTRTVEFAALSAGRTLLPPPLQKKFLRLSGPQEY